MYKSGRPCHIIKKTYKNDRLISESEAGGNCIYWPDFGRMLDGVEEDMVTTQYNEQGNIISKIGPRWEQKFDGNGNLVYAKGQDFEQKCKSNGNCIVTKEMSGYTTTLNCKGDNCTIINVKVSGKEVCSGDKNC